MSPRPRVSCVSCGAYCRSQSGQCRECWRSGIPAAPDALEGGRWVRRAGGIWLWRTDETCGTREDQPA